LVDGLSPWRIAEITIRRQIVHAAAGPKDRLVVQAVCNAEAGSHKAEMFLHHPLLRMLGRVSEIHRSIDRLPVQRNPGRLQCRVDFMRVEGSDAVISLCPDAWDLPADAGR